VGDRHERADATPPAVVLQLPGQGLGLAQDLEDASHVSELIQSRPQLEPDLESLLERGRSLREVGERRERPLKARYRLPLREPLQRPLAGPA
jgi:hypothetical protein